MGKIISHERRRGIQFLDLPGEIRMNVYLALFAHHEPIETKRRPIRIWCEVDQLWVSVDGTSTLETMGSHRSHSGCNDRIRNIFMSDLYLSPEVRTQSAHFPCPSSLAVCDLNLNFLLTCRKIYLEARTLPYSKNTILSRQLTPFSNFTYCLKSWQIHSISSLSVRIPETSGMTKFSAEWNETFSLIAASFLGLRTISVHVQLYDTLSACWSSFWDGGLLELDRLSLEGMEFVILNGTMQPHFTYSAGNGLKSGQRFSTYNGIVGEDSNEQTNTPSDDTAPSYPHHWYFHHCRDCLRLGHQYEEDNDEDLRLFFRFSPNPCPLYVRDLIHLLPRRNRTHAEIRREDILQPDLFYQYAYDPDDKDKAHPIIGYQFSDQGRSEVEIAERVERLGLSRHRLAEKLTSGNSSLNRPRGRRRKFLPDTESDMNRQRHASPLDHVLGDTIEFDDSPPGQWRRLLNEEAFAPFFEVFPPSIPADDRIGRTKLLCTGCSEPIDKAACFLHARA